MVDYCAKTDANTAQHQPKEAKVSQTQALHAKWVYLLFQTIWRKAVTAGSDIINSSKWTKSEVWTHFGRWRKVD